MKPLILSLVMSMTSILPATAQDWALGGYDPVGYAMGGLIPGRSDIMTMWQGQMWHFASEENRAKFEADPRAYAPGFDGLCALSLAEGQRQPGDPRHFVVVGDKLYLLRSGAAEQQMLREPREVVRKAEKAWAALR